MIPSLHLFGMIVSIGYEITYCLPFKTTVSWEMRQGEREWEIERALLWGKSKSQNILQKKVHYLLIMVLISAKKKEKMFD